MTLKSNNNKIPPYVPYRTFRTFLEFLKEGIPDRIDRSVWVTRFSGSSGMQLMTSLKALSLIDDYGRPSPQLEKLVFAQGRERRDLMKQILEDFYSPLFNLDLKKATKNQFREAFRIFGAKEGVLTKCEAFFIKASKDAGIELSQYIVARTHGNSRSSNLKNKSSIPKQIENPVAKNEISEIHLIIVERILDKYPEFDPNWNSEVQSKWMDGMIKLYDNLSSTKTSSIE